SSKPCNSPRCESPNRQTFPGNVDRRHIPRHPRYPSYTKPPPSRAPCRRKSPASARPYRSNPPCNPDPNELGQESENGRSNHKPYEKSCPYLRSPQSGDPGKPSSC